MTTLVPALRLLQFGDSMLPVGAFAFSNGLESAVHEGVVRDAATLRAFVASTLAQAASGDGVALVHAHRAACAGDEAALYTADRAVLLRKLAEETRTMTLRMGRKLGELAARAAPSPMVLAWLAAIDRGATPGTHPAALAIVGAAEGLSEADVFAIHQYGVATTMLSAALRLMRVSHLDAQTLLHALVSSADAAYARSATRSLDHMAGFAPIADILAAVHVRAHVRMFMN